MEKRREPVAVVSSISPNLSSAIFSIRSGYIRESGGKMVGKFLLMIQQYVYPHLIFEWRSQTPATSWYWDLFPPTPAQNAHASWPSAVVFALTWGDATVDNLHRQLHFDLVYLGPYIQLRYFELHYINLTSIKLYYVWAVLPYKISCTSTV